MEMGFSPTIDAPTPQERRKQQEEIIRRVAIESANQEELTRALERVKGLANEDPNNPVYRQVIEQLKDSLEKENEPKTPPTLH